MRKRAWRSALSYDLSPDFVEQALRLGGCAARQYLLEAFNGSNEVTRLEIEHGEVDVGFLIVGIQG